MYFQPNTGSIHKVNNLVIDIVFLAALCHLARTRCTGDHNKLCSFLFFYFFLHQRKETQVLSRHKEVKKISDLILLRLAVSRLVTYCVLDELKKSPLYVINLITFARRNCYSVNQVSADPIAKELFLNLFEVYFFF
jgi:hypothetical protein